MTNTDSRTTIRYTVGGYNGLTDGHLSRITDTPDQIKREDYLCGPDYSKPTITLDLQPRDERPITAPTEICLYCLKIALGSVPDEE
jgi:hypothetical protein